MTTIKILGKEYRVRSDAETGHIERVAEHVDKLLRDAQLGTPDTQDAAILVALNLASDLFRLQQGGVGLPPERIQALIDLVDST